jgi:CRISPR system Cascade subunit CasE
MFLSRLSLSSGSGTAPDLGRKSGNLYQLHQEIWALFADGPGRQRDFLYRFDRERNRPRIRCLSQREPRAVKGIFQVESTRFDLAFLSGERLRFALRANPVVNRQGSRHDVVMDARWELKNRGVAEREMPAFADLAQERGTAWLLERAAKHGFSVDPKAVRVERYEPLDLTKPNGTRVHLGTCDFAGTLTVTDEALFLQTLRQGIGPAKGFGCGLLLCEGAAA